MEKGLVVITGGTKGIGRALVEKFIAEGYTVATCSRNHNDLAKLERKLGKNLHYKTADLSRRDDVAEFATWVLGLNQPIEALVNNTGVFIPGKISEEEDGALERQIETNLYSAYHLTRALLPTMLDKNKGYIFNICSTASIVAYPNGGSYCISKFALLGFTKVLREELKETNLKVSAVLPGATLTASWAGVDLPESRFMPPEDVAEVIWMAYNLSGRTVMEEILLRPQLGDII
jgi:short-subunit dehydrogenase